MRLRPLVAVGWVPLTLATMVFAQSSERVRIGLLAEKLSAAETATRRAAATDLADLGPAAAPAAPELVAALKDKDITVRATAASALLGIGDPAIPSLIEGLKESGSGSSAAVVLAKMGNAGLRALVDALARGTETARVSAGVELGQASPISKRAVPLLFEAFKVADADGRTAIAQVLGKLAEANGPIVMPGVTTALHDADARVRAGAVLTAGQLGGPDRASLIPGLVERLDDAQPEVKQAARDVLVQVGAPAIPALRTGLTNPAVATEAGLVLARLKDLAVPSLVEALASDAPAQRLAAATALAEVGPPAFSGTSALSKALSDSDAKVRAAAANALGRIGGGAAPATAPLASALGDSVPAVRAAAAAALAQTDVEGRTAVPALVKALDDAAPEVQRAAGDSLRQIGRPAVPLLIEMLKDPNASRPIDVLAKIGPNALRELAMGLRNPDASVRAGVAESFGRMGPPAIDALPLLIEALKDAAPEVRVSAAKALGTLAPNSAPAVPALVQVLSGKEKERSVRLAVIVALGQLRAAATTAVPALSAAMRDDDVEIRNAATNSRRLIEGH